MKKRNMIVKGLFTILAVALMFSCSQTVGGLEDTDLDISNISKATYSGSDLVGCVIAFKASNDKYVVSENETDYPLQADRSAIGAWEKFTVVDAGDGDIALKSGLSGKYVCAERGVTGTPLYANRSAIGTWETFEFVDHGDGTCSIYSPYFDKYWKISGDDDDDNALTAGANTVWSNSTFEYTIVSGTPGDDDDDSSSGDYPSDIIPSMSENWKLTLPIDEDGNDSSGASSVDDRNTDPWEVVLDDLVDFEYSPYFTISGSGVQFRAHCAGATTSGSDYPRSELRQEYNGGDNYWDMDDYQRLNTRLKVTHTPVEKPEISIVQIHGPDDEPLRVQYHAEDGMYVIWNESNKDYDTGLDYSLGDIVEVTVVVTGGQIYLTIENDANGNTYTKDWASNDDTGYFKVGAYTQSSIFLNEIKGDDYEDEDDDAYGEVVVYTINLTEN